MKTNALKLTTASLTLSGLATISVDAVTLATDNIFDAVGKIRKPGSTAPIVAAVADNTPHNGTTSGDISWSHSVAGFTQSRIGTPDVVVLGVGTIPGVTVADAQFAPYASMDGSSLTFGREITTDLPLAGSSLDQVLNEIAGVSLLQSWGSTATVGANIVPGNIYQVSLDISTGAGLPVGFLQSTQVGLVGTGLQDAESNAFTKINLVDLVTIGDEHDCTVTFNFQSTEEMTSLGFEFGAETVVDASLVGGTLGNQNLITFSNLSVSPVPEPSVSLFGLTAACLLMGNRRRSTNRR